MIKLIKFDTHIDERGHLSVMQDFDIKRVFWIYNTHGDRAKHAHSRVSEILIAVHGSFNVKTISNGEVSYTFLDSPDGGLYVSNNTWIELLDFSEDAVCLVLADYRFDKDGYIEDLDELKKRNR